MAAARKKATKKAAGKRASRSPATAAMVRRLNRALEESWRHETAEIKALRRHGLPPMGRLPCAFYANFNTFWAGENIQVMRALALERGVKLSELNKVTAAILRRHAARLAKWNLKKTVALFEELARYFERQGPKNAAEFVEVTEAALVAIDRINAWIDAMIPWSQLDKKLKANKPPA